jgi:hypothetical protein
MTNITPTSNTIVSVPSSALNPIEGQYNLLYDSDKMRSLFSELVVGGRSALFSNPIASTIANTAAWANTLVDVIQNSPTCLSGTCKAKLLSALVSNTAKVVFSAPIPEDTSVIEVRYTIRGNVSVMDEFVANGAQTTFNLSGDPQQSQLPSVYINSVYQSNSAFDFTPKTYGLVEMLNVKLLAHTNRLSGVEVAEYSDDTDLERVISTGIALNTLANDLERGGENNNSNNVIYCMSSLFSEDLLKSYANTMRYEIYPAVTNNVGSVNVIFSQLSDMVNGVTNMIQSDLDYYQQVQDQVKYQTLAAFVDTVYNEPSGRYLMKYVIGTNRTREIMEAPDTTTTTED